LHLLAAAILLFILQPAIPADLTSASPRQDLTGSAPLVSVLRSHIMQSCRFPASSIEILSATTASGFVLQEQDLEFRVSARNTPARFHRVVLGFEALSAGKPARPFWVLVDAAVRGRFVKVRRRIPFGAALSSADVEVVEAEYPDVRSEYFSSVDEAVGKVARRALLPGDPLTRDVINDPIVIKSGDLVRLRVSRGNIAVSTMVRAEQNGRVGEIVRVRNLEFERALKARVVAPGEVRVE
jgi:flagella basal body P-ring formation protein FlgA